jgi:hypothetical protein
MQEEEKEKKKGFHGHEQGCLNCYPESDQNFNVGL